LETNIILDTNLLKQLFNIQKKVEA
jgi:hypothetical protein